MKSFRYTKKRKRDGKIEVFDSTFGAWLELKNVLVDYPHLSEKQFFKIPFVVEGKDIQ